MSTDEHHGQGGSYVRDPVTGLRTLVHRTLEQAPAAVAPPATAEPPAAAAPPAAETGAADSKSGKAAKRPAPASSDSEGSERA